MRKINYTQVEWPLENLHTPLEYINKVWAVFTWYTPTWYNQSPWKKSIDLCSQAKESKGFAVWTAAQYLSTGTYASLPANWPAPHTKHHFFWRWHCIKNHYKIWSRHFLRLVSESHAAHTNSSWTPSVVGLCFRRFEHPLFSRGALSCCLRQLMYAFPVFFVWLQLCITVPVVDRALSGTSSPQFSCFFGSWGYLRQCKLRPANTHSRAFILPKCLRPPKFQKTQKCCELKNVANSKISRLIRGPFYWECLRRTVLLEYKSIVRGASLTDPCPIKSHATDLIHVAICTAWRF